MTTKTPDEVLKLSSSDLQEWIEGEEGWTEVHHDEWGGKHDVTEHAYVYRHEATGRCVQVQFAQSYNYGADDFTASEVYPHVVTTTAYKRTPA